MEKAGQSDRPYDKIAAAVSFDGSRAQRMRCVVDALWSNLKNAGVSWVGFYIREGEDELVLGPSRDKPACSPIGLHGACGQALTRREPLVVHDVREFGKDFIACDPRDLSEVVIPLLDDAGACWGVLDLDSFDVGAFDDRDVAGLNEVLRAAGFRAGIFTTEARSHGEVGD